LQSVLSAKKEDIMPCRIIQSGFIDLWVQDHHENLKMITSFLL